MPKSQLYDPAVMAYRSGEHTAVDGDDMHHEQMVRDRLSTFIRDSSRSDCVSSICR